MLSFISFYDFKDDFGFKCLTFVIGLKADLWDGLTGTCLFQLVLELRHENISRFFT